MTRSQAKQCISGKKTSKWYQDKDVVYAATIKSISRKTFNYLRQKRLLALPSQRTLKRWLSKYKIRTGNNYLSVTLDSIAWAFCYLYIYNHFQDTKTSWWIFWDNILHLSAKGAAECCISFDEMYIKEQYTYDVVRFSLFPFSEASYIRIGHFEVEPHGTIN